MENVKKNNSFIKNFNLIMIVFALLISFMFYSQKDINLSADFLSAVNSQSTMECSSNQNEDDNLNESSSKTNDENIAINEPSPYADEKEDEKNKYYEDTLHMVYFAVYYVDYVPSSKKENFTIGTMFLAPQKSSPSMEYDKEKASSSKTVCKLTYAEKEFYIYDDGAIAHNREYKKKNHLSEIPIDMPKAEVVSASGDYKYIGYDYDRTTSFKYKSNKLLPGAKNLNGIDGTNIKATQTSNGYDHLYNITISFYFYKPSTLHLYSKNADFGRFSNNPDTSFDKANDHITLILQEGLKIQIDDFEDKNPNLTAKVTGTYTYIKDSVSYSKEIDDSYYIILNDYCHLKDKIPYKYFYNKGYSISYSFTQDVYDLSFTINTNLSHSENLHIYIGYGYLNQRFKLENGTNKNTTITFENLPAGIKSSLIIQLSSPKSDYKYVISKTPLTTLNKNTKLETIIEAYNEFTLEKDTHLSEINCYIYELYDQNIITRTTEDAKLESYFYKINGIDLPIQKESSKEINGFKFMGYSLDESSMDIISTLTENDNVTLYANWKKEIEATLYYKENYSTLNPNYGSQKYTKIIYNFDSDNTLTINEVPEFDKTNFIGYTNNLESHENVVNFEINDTLNNGDKYYAVFKHRYSLNYDLSHLATDVEIIGDIPEEQFGYSYEIIYGNKDYNNKVIVTDAINFKKQHYDFLGWSTASGGSSDPSSYYQAGDSISIFGGTITLYPILNKHPYTITINLDGGRYETNNSYDAIYDEQTNNVIFTTYNDDLFYFPYSYILKDGYEISKITATNSPENLTSSNNYINIYQDEILVIEWTVKRYNVYISLNNDYIPSLEKNFDVKVSYTYYDELLKSIIYKEEVMNTSNNELTLSLLMGTDLKIDASIEKDGFNLAFNSRTNEENKTCTFIYTSTGDGKTQKIQLLLTRVYKIHLIRSGLTTGNEKETIYKPYSLDYRIPTLSGEKNGFIQTHWNTSDDGTGKDFAINANLNKNVNEEMTLYAVFSKYVRYYLTKPNEYLSDCYTYSLNENDTYKASDNINFYAHKIEKDGIIYYLEGFSSNPNSTIIEYDGTSEKILINSDTWYAVYRTNMLTKTVSESVNVKFHLKNFTIEKNINRTITYSGYDTFFNYDFTVKNDQGYDKKTITYTNDKLEFITDTINDYMIYGWNNSGSFLNPFFTKDDEIIVQNSFDFYPIYRSINYDETKLEHKFYFTINSPISRYSTIYTLSNKFKVFSYDFSSETEYSDTKTYDKIYGNLTFDSLSMQNPNALNTRYKLLGWGISPYALIARWESGEIEVKESTSWYAVWELTDEDTRQETLTHTFYITDTNYITKTTTKTEKIINIKTIMSCDRQFKKVTSEGEIIATNGSKLEFVDLILSNSEFYAWSSSSDSIDEIFTLGESFYPTENMKFYPVYQRFYNLNISYICEGRDDIYKTTSIYVYTNHDNSVIKVNSSNNTYKYIIEDFEWTHNNDKFLGWSYATKDDFINVEENNNELPKYFAGNEILIEDIKEENYITFFAILKQPEIITVTYISNNNEFEKNYLEGDIVTLDAPEEIEGKVFKHWSINSKNYNAGETVTLTSSTEIIAVYVNENENQENTNSNINSNTQNIKDKKSNTGIIILVVVTTCIIITSLVITTILIFKKKRK